MQTLMKHKGKSLFILLLLLFIAIGVAAGISMLPAEAATSSAGKYLTYGSYNNGKAGYMDKYKVYMHELELCLYQDRSLGHQFARFFQTD